MKISVFLLSYALLGGVILKGFDNLPGIIDKNWPFDSWA
jgi:hypothetical protein